MSEKYEAKLPKWNKDSIQALRSHMRLTQQEMAGKMGTRQQTISEWETGMYAPRGASATLLNLLAEKAGFKYNASNSKQDL
jgi:DNA-binding transcriptional regulator YiaG